VRNVLINTLQTCAKYISENTQYMVVLILCNLMIYRSLYSSADAVYESPKTVPRHPQDVGKSQH